LIEGKRVRVSVGSSSITERDFLPFDSLSLSIDGISKESSLVQTAVISSSSSSSFLFRFTARDLSLFVFSLSYISFRY
jgi:hypothetical protein